jgi:hypothetical protein
LLCIELGCYLTSSSGVGDRRIACAISEDLWGIT